MAQIAFVPAAGGLRRRSRCLLLGLAVILSAGSALAQADGASAGKSSDERRVDAYYHFALGHLYHQFAQQYRRQEYVDRAVKEYSTALDADPESVVIRIEMINLYAGANRLPDAERVAAWILEHAPRHVEARRLIARLYRSYSQQRRGGIDEKNLAKAVEHFEKLVEIEPDNAQNHADLGVIYRMAERPDEATKALEKALELDPGLADAQTGLAEVLLQKGRFNEAIALLEEVMDEGTPTRGQIDRLAGAYEQVQRHEDAADLIERMIGMGVSNPRIRLRLAENLLFSKQLGRALEQYKMLHAADNEHYLYPLRISQIEAQRKNFAEAWEAIETARRLDPDSAEIQMQVIGLLEMQGKIAEAVEQMRAHLDNTSKPEYSRRERERRMMLLQELARMQREAESPATAASTYMEIAKLDPSAKPAALASIAQTWHWSREFDRAEKEARKAVAEFPTDSRLVHILVAILGDRGKTREAVRLVERLLDDQEEDIDVWLTVARLYVRARMFDKANVALEKADEWASSDVARVSVLFAYGTLHEASADYETAEARFRDVLEMDPKNANAMNHLGYMFAEQNMHLDEAHELIQKALDIEPDNGAFLDSLGWVYYQQNKLDLAVKFLERSLEEYKDDPTVLSHLGDAYYKQGRVEDARRFWRRGLEEWGRAAPANRDSDEIEVLRKKLSDRKLSIADDWRKGEKKDGVER